MHWIYNSWKDDKSSCYVSYLFNFMNFLLFNTQSVRLYTTINKDAVFKVKFNHHVEFNSQYRFEGSDHNYEHLTCVSLVWNKNQFHKIFITQTWPCDILGIQTCCMYCIDKSMHKQTSRIANSEDRKCEGVNYADHCHGNKAISTTNSMSSSQNDESQGQLVFSRSWHHGLSNSDHPELRFVNDFDSHRRLSHGSRTALLGSHDSHLRLRDPKFAYTSSSPEKSPGIESDDSLSSASSGGPRQTTAYRKRSLRHRRSEDRDLSKLLASSVEESESYQKLQLGDDDGRSSRLGQRNGHRPASVCGYNVLWENRVQELVVSTE